MYFPLFCIVGMTINQMTLCLHYHVCYTQDGLIQKLHNNVHVHIHKYNFSMADLAW